MTSGLSSTRAFRMLSLRVIAVSMRRSATLFPSPIDVDSCCAGGDSPRDKGRGEIAGRLGHRQRHTYREGRPMTFKAADRDRTPMLLHRAQCLCQAESSALDLVHDVGSPMTALEDPRELAFRNAQPLVTDGEQRRTIRRASVQGDVDVDPPAGGTELHGVREYVVHSTLETIGVPEASKFLAGRAEGNGVPLGRLLLLL